MGRSKTANSYRIFAGGISSQLCTDLHKSLSSRSKKGADDGNLHSLLRKKGGLSAPLVKRLLTAVVKSLGV